MLNTNLVRERLGEPVIDGLQGTVGLLETHGEIITGRFYEQLFRHHPELKNIFNMSNQRDGRQRQALATAVYNFATHLDDIENLREQVARIGHKHVSLNVQPEHYPVVGYYLLEAIDAVVTDQVGAAAAAEITGFWKAGYDVYASMMIDFEQGLYRRASESPGGWTGLREFCVTRRVKESDTVASFYLSPVDSQPLPEFRPGQYVSLFVKPEGAEYRQVRQYSLSSSSADRSYFRITVKREAGERQGVVSNFLHDCVGEGSAVELTPPMGDFVLQEDECSPVVFLSAGVGATPVVSMLDTLVDRDQCDRGIHFIHAAEHGGQHVFKKHIEDQVSRQAGRLKHTVFYRQPRGADRLGRDFHYPGTVDLERIRDQIEQPDASYYLCGPMGFMQRMHSTLAEWGVPAERLHYEMFGPNKVL